MGGMDSMGGMGGMDSMGGPDARPRAVSIATDSALIFVSGAFSTVNRTHFT